MSGLRRGWLERYFFDGLAKLTGWKARPDTEWFSRPRREQQPETAKRPSDDGRHAGTERERGAAKATRNFAGAARR